MKERVIAIVFAVAVSLYAVSRLFTKDDPNPVISLPPAPIVTEGELRDTIERAEINRDNVVTVISTLKRAENYHQQLTMRLYSGGEYSETNFEVWASGDSYRLKDYSTGKLTGNTLIIGLEMWRWYDGADRYIYGNLEKTPFRKADSFLGMPVYEEIELVSPDDIIDAGISTEEYKDPCIYVVYRSGRFGYETRMFISQTSGLLVFSETYDEDKVISSVISENISIGVQGEENFVPPV